MDAGYSRCRCENLSKVRRNLSESAKSKDRANWNPARSSRNGYGSALLPIRNDDSSGRFNIAMLEDTSSRASSYFRSVRRGYKTRRMRRFRRELAYGWNRTWYPRCLHRSWNGYPRWKRRSPFRIGLYPCKSYERAVAQSPRRGIQAAARVGVYADVIDHVVPLVSTGWYDNGKIVSTRPSLPRNLATFHLVSKRSDPRTLCRSPV